MGRGGEREKEENSKSGWEGVEYLGLNGDWRKRGDRNDKGWKKEKLKGMRKEREVKMD